MRDFAMDGKKVKNNSTDAARMLAGGSIEHGAWVDRICRFYQLGDECFVSSLAEFKLQFELVPDVAGGRNSRAGSRVGQTNTPGFAGVIHGTAWAKVSCLAADKRSPKWPSWPPPNVEGTDLALAFSSVETFCRDS
jgi:hypothetical protein